MLYNGAELRGKHMLRKRGIYQSKDRRGGKIYADDK